MVLYVPVGSEDVVTDTYLRQFWSASCGYSNTAAHPNCALGRFRRIPEPGWHPDPTFTESGYCCGGHGGCVGCIMVLSQVIANYQTEVTFISNLPGAQIFIDGAEWWPGALTAADGATFRGIPPGIHTYELRIAGHPSETGTFDLALNTPIILPCKPVWQCEPGQTGNEADGCGNRRENPVCLPKGSINFSSTPPGAEVFLNGTDQGVKTLVTITDVPVGLHDYTLKLAGFLDSTGTVQVVENQTITVSTQLIPAEGCIYFITSVPGAKIYVDNVNTGKVTPALVCGLNLATHTYLLVLPGYAVITGSVVLGAGQGVIITKTLVAEVKKGAGALILVTLLGMGVLGAVVFATKEKKEW